MLDRLEDGARARADFVADAGHELRTPLALLRTELELALRQARTADELRAAIRCASAEVDRLSQLAEGLLLIARTDRGSLPLDGRADRGRVLFSGVPSASAGASEPGSTSPVPAGLVLRG